MRRRAQRVRPYQLFGPPRLAPLQRLDDLEMVRHRTIGTVVLTDRRLPYCAHVNEEVPRHVLDELAAAEPDGRLVEGDIGVGILVHVFPGMAALEAGEER